jgi:diacylglycerol kinase family enzyme
MPQPVSDSPSMRALLIHNPSAGGKSLSCDDLARLLKEAGYETEIRSPKDATADDFAAARENLIIAAGGDGTVTTVALAVPVGTRIGVIPLGTANNIANSLGITGRPEEIIAGWSSAAARTVDIWRARGPWGERAFIEGCGVGALARAAHQMDDNEIEGHSPEHEISIARAALAKVLSQSEPVPAKLILDDDTLEGRFLLLEMLNFGAVGPRLPLAWSADPSDGYLEIGYTLEEHYNDFCEWLADGASPLADAPVTLLRSRTIEVTWQSARFRIGDHYWPETGMPEPRAIHQATIDLVSSGPRILVPHRTAKPEDWNS